MDGICRNRTEVSSLCLNDTKLTRSLLLPAATTTTVGLSATAMSRPLFPKSVTRNDSTSTSRFYLYHTHFCLPYVAGATTGRELLTHAFFYELYHAQLFLLKRYVVLALILRISRNVMLSNILVSIVPYQVYLPHTPMTIVFNLKLTYTHNILNPSKQ